MDNHLSNIQKSDIAFIGSTLGPLFTDDPLLGESESLYSAFSQIDEVASAHEWPFVCDEDAETSLKLMRSGISGLNESQNDPVKTALADEFRRLFVGPNTKAAPPWGSVYTDRDCVIFGRTTIELRRWMREVGVAKIKDDGEPEDHIGSMLLLMSWIVENRPETLCDYLQLHLLTWAPHFLDIMKEATTHPFYRGLAQLTKDSLIGIQSALNLEVKIPRFYK